MNDSFDEILADLPEKCSRSRLEPYGELIYKLLRRGRTYREVASILLERCNVHASISTIHDFVRRRAAAARKARGAAGSDRKTRHDPIQKGDNTVTNHANPDDVQQRITALKLRRAITQIEPAQFHYDPNEPLRVPGEPLPRSSGKGSA